MLYFHTRKSKKVIGLQAVVLILLASLAAGCSSNAAVEPSGEEAEAVSPVKKVTVIRNLKADSLDPRKSWEPLRAGITETLTRLNEKMEITPWLAEGWEAVDDTTWRFRIREGITFHDGAKLDAAAVKASLEDAMKASEALAVSLKISRMDASGQELTIVTSEPYPALPSELVNPYTSIIHAAAKRKPGEQAIPLSPVGTGPYTAVKFTPNVEIVLQRFEGYWDGAAPLDEVVYKFNEDGNVRALALQAGEADIVYQLPAETITAVESEPELRVESLAGLRVYLLMFNQQKPAMKDIRVRKAFDLLLNRESIVNDIMLGHGTAASGPFHAGLPFGSRESAQPIQIEEAKRLLVEAGYKEEKDGKLYRDGKPLTLEVVTYKGRPELPLIAQLLQADAAKAGVTLKINVAENADVYLRENKQWDMATYAILSSPRGDGGYFLNAALTPGGSINPANIRVNGLEDTLDELNRTSDMAKRIEWTRQAADIVKREVPHAYAVYPNLIVGVNRRVTGWTPGPEEYYIVTNKLDVK
ncbi:ABC transporter substrate-binding protein [Paenibacillus sp. N4]|uniref:nickel ABC transporter substrate-binding protein n=1 Tax=Paenibacillus vietnamensis TaxID=2590547 RepID=UPI001CD0AA21|nr:nickel ABC transporter substrate-binding protein [Paenibacillus vietnamensis]MCA0756634.1 ABC transporter substrate-binding protein [Paenibacillus vietnamensis]